MTCSDNVALHVLRFGVR